MPGGAWYGGNDYLVESCEQGIWVGDGGNKVVGGGEGKLHESKYAYGAGMGMTLVECLPHNTQHRLLLSTLPCQCSPHAHPHGCHRAV